MSPVALSPVAAVGLRSVNEMLRAMGPASGAAPAGGRPPPLSAPHTALSVSPPTSGVEPHSPGMGRWRPGPGASPGTPDAWWGPQSGDESPQQTRRRLRLGMVSDRVDAITAAAADRARSCSRSCGRGRTPGGGSIAARLRDLEMRLRELEQGAKARASGSNADALTDLSGQAAQLPFAAEQSRAEWTAKLQRLRERVSEQSAVDDGLRPPQQVAERFAPWLYHHLEEQAWNECRAKVAGDATQAARAARWRQHSDNAAALRARSDALSAVVRRHGELEEELVRFLRSELGTLTVRIDEERARRKQMETMFVSLMESIIMRLYQDMDSTFAERNAMETHLRGQVVDTAHRLRIMTGIGV